MSGEQLHVAARPCPTCPYRRDTPPGIWHPTEYAKLPTYDPGGVPELAVFHCHQENATGRPSVCVGWLGCHGFDAPAVRLAYARGQVTDVDIERAESTDVDLYDSGAQAAAAGLAGCGAPSEDAAAAMRKLVRRGAGRW